MSMRHSSRNCCCPYGILFLPMPCALAPKEPSPALYLTVAARRYGQAQRQQVNASHGGKPCILPGLFASDWCQHAISIAWAKARPKEYVPGAAHEAWPE